MIVYGNPIGGSIRIQQQFVCKVDMGTLEWYENEGSWYFAQVPDMVENPSFVKCARYNLGTNSFSWSLVDIYEDKTINTTTTNNFIYIKDTAYSDVASFKRAMSGVILYYEIAAPV